MASKITNNAWGVLNVDITATDTSLALVAGGTARFPTLSTGDFAWGTLSNQANQLEIVKITAISGDTVQVVRGQDNTTARAYAAGDRIDLRITAALLNGKIDAAEAVKAFATTESPTLNNASLTGVTTSVTPPADANDTRVATTAYVVSRGLASALPGQAGNAGKFISTDGTTASWTQVYPPLAGNAGKILSNDGTNPVWVSSGSTDVQQSLTDGTTINWNLASGKAAVVTLGGDRTVAAPAGMSVGTCIMVVKQDATGNRKLSWNSVFKWPGATPPVLSTAAGAVDVLSFYCDGTFLYGGYLRGVG
jgi:hypothetical protein